MNRESALALRDEVIAEFILPSVSEDHESVVSMDDQSSPLPSPKHRMGVGISRIGEDDYRLEIRVQRDRGVAFNKALEFKQRAKGEARIGISKKVEIPTRIALIEGLGSKRGRAKHLEQLRNEIDSDASGWLSDASIEKQLQSAATLRSNRRPLEIGLSIGHLDGGAGTLGFFADNEHGEVLVSNSHVIALSGNAQVDTDHVFQPGHPDVRSLSATQRVGKLRGFVEISKWRENFVDCAFASIDDSIACIGNIVPPGHGYPNNGRPLMDPGHYWDLEFNENVAKIGRTTGYTEGRGRTIVDELTVLMPNNKGNARFSNLLEVEWLPGRPAFSAGGDSGSLVYGAKSLRPVGLHFASGPIRYDDGTQAMASYACSLVQVLDDLNLSWMQS